MRYEEKNICYVVDSHPQSIEQKVKIMQTFYLCWYANKLSDNKAGVF